MFVLIGSLYSKEEAEYCDLCLLFGKSERFFQNYRRILYEVCDIVLLDTMKWTCVYCNKVMDETNFVDYIKDSDKGEYHGGDV